MTVTMKSRVEILDAQARARQKWKDTGDPVWAYAEAALAWAAGSDHVTPEILSVLDNPLDTGA